MSWWARRVPLTKTFITLAPMAVVLFVVIPWLAR